MTALTTPFFIFLLPFIIQTQTNMSSSNRQASLSPGERQRTPSNTVVDETDARHNKTLPKAYKRNTREKKTC